MRLLTFIAIYDGVFDNAGGVKMELKSVDAVYGFQCGVHVNR